MVRAFLKVFLVLSFISGGMSAFGQARIFSEVRLNKNEVYVGEPVELTISVYTSTFFTKGVDLGNIQVNGAFSVYFRSVSNSRKVDGVTYAGVDLIYTLFPFEVGSITIPSFNIEVVSPNPGDFKGSRRSLNTAVRSLSVIPPPDEIPRQEWIVANSLSVSDVWDRTPSEVKVGEVLERNIRRRVSGTVAELIPPMQWDSVDGVRLYPTRAEIDNQKTRTSISATRIEGVRYLFEREGEIEIPDREIVWWHPYRKKLYKRMLKGKTIKVLPNPDLEMLTTAKSNLESAKREGEELQDTGPLTILGMDWKRFVLVLVMGLVLLYLLIRGGRWLWGFLMGRYRVYRVSERYAFRTFLKALRKGVASEALSALYFWLDHLELTEPTLQAFFTKAGMPEIRKEVEPLLRGEIDPEWKRDFPDRRFWIKARRQYLKRRQQTATSGEWINP